MAAQFQADLIKEIADLAGEYRAGTGDFVKFGMKCAIALNKIPSAAGIMHSPKQSDETFQINDPEFRAQYGSDKEAFFAAFDQFVANGQFLAWHGQIPETRFAAIPELSENFTWPTMMTAMIYRRRGSNQEKKLNMFFIGFPDDATATTYAQKNFDHLIATKPFHGKFYDWS